MTSSAAKNHTFLIGATLMLVSALGLSFKPIFIKLIYAQEATMDAIGLLAFRLIWVLPVVATLLVVAAIKSNVKLTRHDHVACVGLGFLGYYLSSILDFTGLQYISANLERMILFLYPSFVVLIAAWANRRRMTRVHVVSLAICYLGIALMFGHDETNEFVVTAKGAILVFFAAISFAVFIHLSASVIARIGAVLFSAYALTVSASMALLHYAIQHGVHVIHASPSTHTLIAALAVFSTIIPIFAMSKSIKLIGASNAVIVSTAGPVFTLVFAYFILGEALTAMQLLGMGFIIGGIFYLGKK